MRLADEQLTTGTTMLRRLRWLMSFVHSMARGRRVRWHIIVLAMLAIPLGCHDLTDVEAPDLVDPTALDNPQGAAARYAGAIGDFAAGYVSQARETGLLSDEFQNVSNNPVTSDRRLILPLNNYPFAALSRARISAFRAITTLQRFAPEPPQRAGELYALIGFVDVMFAENLCGPVPLADVVDGVPVEAPSYDRDALLEQALAMFDSASTYAGASDTVQNLSRVGRARALLQLGELDAAATAAEDVPLSFTYLIPYSAAVSEQRNEIYNSISSGFISVSDREGTNGLPFVSGSDPRIGSYSLGSSVSGHPVYNFVKDAGFGAPIVLASGIEAALVQSEDALAKGDTAAWADILESLRETAAPSPIPPIGSDSTAAAGADLRIVVLFHERAFWLFGTGHRQGDMLRLIREYGRAAEATFPTGEYLPASGLDYGPDIVFSPSGEETNTTYGGCDEDGA